MTLATSRIIIPRKTWPQAEIVSDPLKQKAIETSDPVVLVRRKTGLVLGPRNEELLYLPGHPAISLFTGAGGIDLGLEAAGFVTLCQHEWMSAACETLIMNRPRAFRYSALIQGDIRKTPTSMILREAGLRCGEAHLLAGGPPCQGFSIAGKRSPDDPRNDLVFEYLRVVREAQPRFFLFENVQGFVSFNQGQYLKAFLEAAFGAFYELVYGLIDAVEYCVPQYRCRFMCMGTRRDLVDCDGIMGSLPRPVTFAKRDLVYLQRIKSESLFGGDFDELAELITHAPGIRYFPDRPILIPPAPVHDGGRSSTFIEFYKRLLKDEPDRFVACPQGGDD